MCLGTTGRVVEITNAEKKLGKIDVSGAKLEVDLACIADADHPLDARIDFVMSRIDERQAAMTLEIPTRLGKVQAEHAAMRASGQT